MRHHSNLDSVFHARRRDNPVIGRGDLRSVVRDLQQACDPAVRALRDAALSDLGAERVGVRRR